MRPVPPPRALVTALAALLPLAASPAAAQEPRPGAATRPAEPELAPDVAASARGDELDFAELDAVLLDRHGRSEQGRAALRHLCETLLVERVAAEEGVTPSDADVDRRAAQLDREIRKSGEKGGLEAYLAQSGVDRATFRHYMRLQIAQEILTRRALGIPAGDPVTGEQQTTWISAVLEERGYEILPAPWGEVVARCGDLEIGARELARHLRTQLAPEDVRDACYEILLARRMRARMPDLAPEALERALDAELARRRAEAEADPRYKGLAYEALLAATGLTLDVVRRDPAVVATVLGRLWVERRYSADDLRATYEAERAHFDGLHGEAVETYVLFLLAAERANELVPRTLDRADAELAKLRGEIDSLTEFAAAATKHSEDRATREQGGRLGLVARGDPRVPDAVRAAVFAALDSGRYPRTGEVPLAARLLGPLHTGNGSALLWLGERRPPPTWETMAGHVRRELRKRFTEEVLKPREVKTYLDVE